MIILYIFFDKIHRYKCCTFAIYMKVSSNKISDIINYYQQMLNNNYDENSSRQLLRELISNYTNIKFHEISLNLDKRISESQLLNIHFGVKKLMNNEPIQYIIGKTEFSEVILNVNKHTLIPRPETEELVMLIENAHKNNNSKNLKILDIGTGSGSIAISIQKILGAEVTAIDFSEEALKTAQQNSEENNTSVTFKQIDFLDQKQWEQLGNFDIIISNPPYVLESEKDLMAKNVLEYEPGSALFVPNDKPLIFYEAIAEFAKTHLKKDGEIWLEINESLGEKTAALYKGDYTKVEIIKDFRDRIRFCRAQKTL